MVYVFFNKIKGALNKMMVVCSQGRYRNEFLFKEHVHDTLNWQTGPFLLFIHSAFL